MRKCRCFLRIRGLFMYSEAFCNVYNQFGWNYFPEAFGEQLLEWLSKNNVKVSSSLDLGCGTGVLCEILHAQGIDANGMDFSEGMIKIAKERNSKIHYEVGDMITYLPEKKFDLVTCTGDALNHIMDLENIEKIFGNVYQYLTDQGYFIFDILNEKEVPMEEPINLEFSETVKAQFLVTHDEEGRVNLQTTVFENGTKKFVENIKETVHDIKEVCCLLEKAGFQILQCSHYLLENEGNCSSTWYVITKKSFQ